MPQREPLEPSLHLSRDAQEIGDKIDWIRKSAEAGNADAAEVYKKHLEPMLIAIDQAWEDYRRVWRKHAIRFNRTLKLGYDKYRALDAKLGREANLTEEELRFIGVYKKADLHAARLLKRRRRVEARFEWLFSQKVVAEYTATNSLKDRSEHKIETAQLKKPELIVTKDSVLDVVKGTLNGKKHPGVHDNMIDVSLFKVAKGVTLTILSNKPNVGFLAAKVECEGEVVSNAQPPKVH